MVRGGADLAAGFVRAGSDDSAITSVFYRVRDSKSLAGTPSLMPRAPAPRRSLSQVTYCKVVNGSAPAFHKEVVIKHKVIEFNGNIDKHYVKIMKI